ncbi:histidine kinase [Porticoccaceae bacterium]|nr:histidine kinase [Porticoccaceae bacterium]
MLRLSITLSLPNELEFTAAAWCAAIPALIGFVLSTLLYLFYRRTRYQVLSTQIVISIIAVIGCAFLFSLGSALLVKLSQIGVSEFELNSINLLHTFLYHFPNNLYLLMAWSGLYYGLVFYQQSLNDQALAASASAAATQAELEVLRYQLHPHLLFNSLNAISGMIVQGKTEDADQLVQRLGGFLRHMLISETSEKISLVSEIAFAERYLQIEQARFGERLTIETLVNDRVKHAKVPAFILQPLVENAIKHGVSIRDGKCSILIDAVEKNRQIELVVRTKTECQMDQDHVLLEGIGHNNIRRRLKLHYDERANLLIEQPTVHEYCARIVLPLLAGQQTC